MEAHIIAALVTASGGLLGKIIEWASRRDSKATADADRVIDKTYDVLRGGLTDGCVQVLRLLESGENQAPFQIRAKLYPSLQLKPDILHQFDAEFRYRLEYLRTYGVLTMVGGSEYGITRLGQSFLMHARGKRDYYKVLFE